MNQADRNALVSIPIIVLLGAGMALAGSQGGATAGRIPVFALAVGLIFLIQWLAFLLAYVRQTERFFDLTGSLTYISVTLAALALSRPVDARAMLLAALVVVWAGRLGSFLALRVHKAGKDARFDDIKPSFVRFLNVWTLQALWITITAAAALAAITTTARKAIDAWGVAGLLVWICGFAMEATADAQKNRFRADPANRGRFIQSGLWGISRHPNYLGEIVIWIGVVLIAIPVLRGWQWVTLISPVFVAVLLTRISGIPLLEKRADARWGGQEDYEAYKARTPVLVPRIRGLFKQRGR